MLKKVVLIGLLAAPLITNAAMINVSLETENHYALTQNDNIAGSTDVQTIQFAPQSFDVSVSVNENTAKTTEFSSFDAGSYIQHSARTEYSDFDVIASSPFEGVFANYLSANFGLDPAFIVEDVTSLDFLVFFNETADPGFVGGDVSIRFDQYLAYSQPGVGQNSSLQESYWLSGRIFLGQVNSMAEFNLFSTMALEDFFDNVDGAYSYFYTNAGAGNFDNNPCGDFSCDPVDKYTSLNGAAFGVASLNAIPEPASAILLLSGLFALRARQKRG